MQNRTRIASFVLALVSGFAAVAISTAPASADGTHQCVQRNCDPQPPCLRNCPPANTAPVVSPARLHR